MASGILAENEEEIRNFGKLKSLSCAYESIKHFHFTTDYMENVRKSQKIWWVQQYLRF